MNTKTLRIIALVWPPLALAASLIDNQAEMAMLWGGLTVGVVLSRFLEWRAARETVPH